MPESNPVRGLRSEIAVKCYWGAMDISYGLPAGLIILVGIILYYLAHDPPTGVCLTVVTATILVSNPFLY